MTNNNNKNRNIVCPCCGCEYIFAEIYTPKGLFGKPKEISRDYRGKILNISGELPDLTETYTCDKCDTTFKVKAYMNFNTSLITIKDTTSFEEEFSTPLFKESLTLEEDTHSK